MITAARQVAYHPTNRIAYIQAPGATVPPGCQDIGDTDGTTPNHALIHDVRDLFYKRKPNGTASGVFPENITDIDRIEIVLGVTAISVLPATASLAAEETIQLVSTFTPAEANAPTVTYATSNAAVATVNASGLVTAVAAGSATITASMAAFPGITDTVAVTVTE